MAALWEWEEIGSDVGLAEGLAASLDEAGTSTAAVAILGYVVISCPLYST